MAYRSVSGLGWRSFRRSVKNHHHKKSGANAIPSARGCSERWLMEGSYTKVWRARERVPREEYGVLLEGLVGTIR
jgi:hypothetical protein